MTPCRAIQVTIITRSIAPKRAAAAAVIAALTVALNGCGSSGSANNSARSAADDICARTFAGPLSDQPAKSPSQCDHGP